MELRPGSCESLRTFGKARHIPHDSILDKPSSLYPAFARVAHREGLSSALKERECERALKIPIRSLSPGAATAPLYSIQIHMK